MKNLSFLYMIEPGCYGIGYNVVSFFNFLMKLQIFFVDERHVDRIYFQYDSLVSFWAC